MQKPGLLWWSLPEVSVSHLQGSFSHGGRWGRPQLGIHGPKPKLKPPTSCSSLLLLLPLKRPKKLEPFQPKTLRALHAQRCSSRTTLPWKPIACLYGRWDFITCSWKHSWFKNFAFFLLLNLLLNYRASGADRALCRDLSPEYTT